MANHNITPANQQEFLNKFSTFLQEFGYEAALMETEVGDSKSYSTLYTVLDISSDQLPGDNQLRLETAFLPQAEDELGGHAILQMMVPILVADEKVNKQELFALIIKLNTFLPMGSFGYWEEQNMVYHKQNNMLASENTSAIYATMEEHIGMIQYVLTSFVPSLAAVAVDMQNMDDALKNNPFAQVYLGQ